MHPPSEIPCHRAGEQHSREPSGAYGQRDHPADRLSLLRHEPHPFFIVHRPDILRGDAELQVPPCYADDRPGGRTAHDKEGFPGSFPERSERHHRNADADVKQHVRRPASRVPVLRHGCDGISPAGGTCPGAKIL
ncbi:hypothetical protein [Phocaeicola sartorii]|uniref:hypothetical protein n=1 Tax=Phocaeicola sartorii TaxID=671267 RepID=UPI0025A4F09B|nr:hypothetical protein [Phocaeicola sartorii]